MTTLKQAAETLAKLARNEAVDPGTLRAVSEALAVRLEALKAPHAPVDRLTLAAGEPAREKPFRIDRTEAAVQPLREAYTAALERAESEAAAFEEAMRRLMDDKAVTVKVLRSIAADYTGAPVTARTTRADAERLLRQAFARRQWQTEAYRRLDALNAGK